MDEKEIQNLIERKISEAKLHIADSRFNYLVLIAGGLLAVFGIIVPIWQANTSAEKVDKALAEMKSEFKEFVEASGKLADKHEARIEKYTQDANSFFNSSNDKIDKEIETLDTKFKELAGVQLRKPNLVCLYKGKSIENITLEFNNLDNDYTFEIKNLGDAPAKNIYARAYLQTNENVSLYHDFDPQYFSDEPEYSKAFELRTFFNSIDPKDYRPVRFDVSTESTKEMIIPVLFKVYYEQPEPIRYNFNIKIKFKKEIN